ncbi:hypothetical protein A5893_04190 [Pedobacter psychrophilus]|uniref:DUF4174 domain-containing protein n=1 Tax=Pedobacter psychrophilus TaxID=1826909 RepID=A0A179DN72_9SPHI|nr:DUF4174 domain-containing protein [Pedobacter psychrophilus]OAQ42318.1 hypothetical protein A5893_04190 [Pedobacter psychrophilus]
MKLFHLLIICFSLNVAIYAQNKDNREVILFYPNNKADIASKQLKILSADLAGLSERQIRIIRVVTNSKDFENYSPLKINPNLFTVVLVGKDGGQKFSSNEIITSAKLYDLIDQMPMRKQEMKGKN